MRDGRAAAGRRAMNEASAPPPPRTDPLAAALAFAVREAVRLEAERLEAEREALNCAPVRANVVLVNTKRKADAA